VDEPALFGAAGGGAWGSTGALEVVGRGAVLLRHAERLAPRTLERLGAAAAAGDFARGDGRVVPLGARLLASAGRAPATLRAALDRGGGGGCVVEVPPLRARVVDIRPLAEHFLRAAASDEGAPELRLDDEAAAWLERQPWPGNVAELRRVVEVAALRAGAREGAEPDGRLGSRPLRDAAALGSWPAPPAAGAGRVNQEPDRG
jgi:transcriptional regulator with AAA-type ATPase domain